jgi:hypothetical protein
MNARWLRSGSLVPLLMAAPALVCAAQAGEMKPAFEVRWPPGWAVSQQPGPEACGQPSLLARAVKGEPGSTDLAAVQVMQVKRCDGGKATLEPEMASAVREVRQQYESRGLAVKAGRHRSSTLGGRPALETEVDISGPGVDVRVTLAIALGRDHVFSFTFAAGRASHARHQAAVQSTLSSLKLH